MTEDRGYITNCLMIASHEQKGAMFTTDGTPFLDKYAIIPMAIFDAMGGRDHPSCQKYLAEQRENPWTAIGVPKAVKVRDFGELELVIKDDE